MLRFLIFTILFSLTACGIGESMGPLKFTSKIEEAVRPDEVNFAVLEKRILPKCIGCHQDWTSEEIVNRFTRENDPDNSRLYTTIVTGDMPKDAPKLSAVDQEIVRNYIQNFQWTFPNEEPLPEDGKPVSFETLNEKVFKISCLPCHGRTLGEEASLIKKWIDKNDPEKSKLLLSITSGRMPKERNLLTPNQVEIIRRYLRGFHVGSNTLLHKQRVKQFNLLLRRRSGIPK